MIWAGAAAVITTATIASASFFNNMTKRFMRIIGPALLALFIFVDYAQSGRLENLTTSWADKGPKMELAAATFFGGTDPEGFIGAVQLNDGTIAAFGNAYGPGFPLSPAPVILGKGRHKRNDPFIRDNGTITGLKTFTPDMSGFFVFYQPDLRKIKKVVKFDWGVATISAAICSSYSNHLFIAGYCKRNEFLSFVGYGAEGNVARLDSGKEERSTAVYVMEMDSLARTVIRYWIVEYCYEAPEKLWQDDSGNIYFVGAGFNKIPYNKPDLIKISRFSDLRHNTICGIDPNDGGFFLGGDWNTAQRDIPWRSPFLYKIDPQGEKIEWKLWEWDASSDQKIKDIIYTLLSDSSVREVEVAPDRDLIVVGWSDGGNSVFTRQPLNIEESAGKPEGPIVAWGMQGAISIAYILRLDPVTFKQKMWSYWLAFLPEAIGGIPNSINIDQLLLTAHSTYSFCGDSASGLIQTPNSFCGEMNRLIFMRSGRYATVVDQNFSNLWFSSYLPGYIRSSILEIDDGIVIVGTTRKQDNAEVPCSPPAVKAIQDKLGGGEFDGHIILLKWPHGLD